MTQNVQIDTGTRPERGSASAYLEVGLTPPPRPSWVSPGSDKLLVLLFAIFLVLPPIAYWFGWTSEVRENRNLTPFPDLGAEPIASLPGKLEAYYNDRFGLRST